MEGVSNLYCSRFKMSIHLLGSRQFQLNTILTQGRPSRRAAHFHSCTRVRVPSCGTVLGVRVPSRRDCVRVRVPSLRDCVAPSAPRAVTAKRYTYTAKRHTYTYTNEPALIVGVWIIAIGIAIAIEFDFDFDLDLDFDSGTALTTKTDFQAILSFLFRVRVPSRRNCGASFRACAVWLIAPRIPKITNYIRWPCCSLLTKSFFLNIHGVGANQQP
jgi:hypothetical protein